MKTYEEEFFTDNILTDKLGLSQEESEPKSMNFDIIRKKRKERGMSQVELAEKAGMSDIYLSRVENGKVPQVSLDIISRICKVLDISVCLVNGDFTEEEVNILENLRKMKQ